MGSPAPKLPLDWSLDGWILGLTPLDIGIDSL